MSEQIYFFVDKDVDDVEFERRLGKMMDEGWRPRSERSRCAIRDGLNGNVVDWQWGIALERHVQVGRDGRLHVMGDKKMTDIVTTAEVDELASQVVTGIVTESKLRLECAQAIQDRQREHDHRVKLAGDAEAYKAALLKYGRHALGCPGWIDCACGWDEMKKGL